MHRPCLQINTSHFWKQASSHRPGLPPPSFEQGPPHRWSVKEQEPRLVPSHTSRQKQRCLSFALFLRHSGLFRAERTAPQAHPAAWPRQPSPHPPHRFGGLTAGRPRARTEQSWSVSVSPVAGLEVRNRGGARGAHRDTQTSRTLVQGPTLFLNPCPLHQPWGKARPGAPGPLSLPEGEHKAI